MKLIKYLPGKFKQVKEFEVFLSSQQAETERARKGIERSVDEIFVESAGSVGLSKFEKELGLEQSAEDLDLRRICICNAMSNKVPATYWGIHSRLISLAGENNFKIDIDNARYYLKIRIRNTTGAMIMLIRKLFRDIIPANLIFFVDEFSLIWRDVMQYAKMWKSIDEAGLTWKQLECYYES